MSEEMTRKEVIHQLRGLLRGLQLGELRITTKERKALEYAISSLETDEAYQLEYERTTKNDCETCIHNKGVLECDMYGCKYEPTTKNDLGVDVHDNNVGNIDCISRADAIGSIAVECSAENLDIDYAKFLMLKRAIKALPAVTPQAPRWISF